MKKFISFIIILCYSSSIWAQSLVLNTMGKEPVIGKYQQLIVKEEKGEWLIKFYDQKIVEFNFLSTQLNHQEQLSDAVIAKPIVLNTQIKKTSVYTIQLENGLSLVYQQGAWYFKDGNKVLLKKLNALQQNEERGFEFVINPEEAFYGGGERALPMNRVGYSFPLYNNPHYGYEMGADALNFSVPFFISSEGYGVFFNNGSSGKVDLGKTDSKIFKTTFHSGALQFYVMAGNTVQKVLQNYHSLTGSQPLPPRWAFGNFVSRFGYRNEKQVNEVVDSMKHHQFKMDALVFDLFWFGDSIKGTMGNLQWMNQNNWPNPPMMLKKLQQKNIKPIAIIEPFILEGTAQFENAKTFLAIDEKRNPYMLQDFYFGKGGLIDIFKPSAKQFMSKFYIQQMKNGIVGWWTDLGEPEKHPKDLFHDLSHKGYKRLFAADEVHNLYGHEWNKFVYDVFKDNKNERLFHLNRSGFAGSQRYSVFPWTGDVARTWKGLEAQVPLLLGMSLSGIPYIHSDAGGFSMVDKADPTLYVRWLSFATFTPIFRPHGTALGDLEAPEKNIPSEPAFWPEPYRSFVKHWIDLRYAMIPYNYNLAFQQVKDGKPLMRPLNFEDFTVKESLDKSYYWGESFWVHPITEASNENINLQLPKGSWYDFYTNEMFQENSTTMYNHSLQKIPLYVKAGSFIPYWTNSNLYNSIDQYIADSLSVIYYPHNQASYYEWFDDDGKSANSLEKAAYEILHFTAQPKNGTIEIEVKSPILKTNQLKKRVIDFFIPSNYLIQEVIVNDQKITVSNNQLGVSKLQEKTFTKFSIQFTGKPIRILLK